MATASFSSVISEFLADPVRTSLELPHMTTGQRKDTKQLVQQHPELRCESFGFGQERQLHLFKVCAQAEEGKLESRRGALTVGSLVKMSSPEPRLGSPDCSTDEPSEALSETSSESGPLLVTQAMQAVVHVRNTFIHCENPNLDERVVKTMPRNMFSQLILEESLQEQEVMAPETHPNIYPFEEDAQAVQPVPLRPGMLVVVEGLVKLPAFNGRSAVVQGWDGATGRYSIMIESPAGGRQEAQIKEGNLRVVIAR